MVNVVPWGASIRLHSHIIAYFSRVSRGIFRWLMGLFASFANARLLVGRVRLAGSPVNCQGFWSRAFDIRQMQKDMIRKN